MEGEGSEEETDHSERRHSPAGQWGWHTRMKAGPGRTQAEAEVSGGYQKRKEGWKSLWERRGEQG